jgi:hypothetical protein
VILSEAILRVALELPIADKDPERISAITTAIADAAEADPLFAGEHGAEKTALLLLSIAHHESGLRDNVRTCAVKGDGGRSISAYQLNGKWAWGGYAPEDICSSDALQAKLALRVLHRHVANGVRGVPLLLRAYASGSAGKNTWQSRELERTFQHVVLRAETARP